MIHGMALSQFWLCLVSLILVLSLSFTFFFFSSILTFYILSCLHTHPHQTLPPPKLLTFQIGFILSCPHWLVWFLVLYINIHLYTKGTSQSAPEYSLSLKKLPTIIKILTPPSLVPKNRVDHSFQNCFDTWCPNCMVWSSDGCLCPETA